MNLPDLPNGYAWRLCGADGVTTLALAVWTGPRCRYGLGLWSRRRPAERHRRTFDSPEEHAR